MAWKVEYIKFLCPKCNQSFLTAICAWKKHRCARCKQTG